MKSSSRLMWLLVASSLLLAGIALAFTSGYWLAVNKPASVTIITPSTPAETVETPEEVPVISGDVTWLPLTEQTRDVMTPRLKDGLLGTSFGGDLIQSVGVGTLDTDSILLGTVNTGPYLGYELKEQHLAVGELGGSTYTFYTLEIGKAGSKTPEAPSVVLLTKHSDVGAGSDTFSLTEISAFMIRIGGVASNMEIPELTFGAENETVNGNLFVPVYISSHWDFSSAVLADALKYKIIGQTSDGRDLRAYHRTTAYDKTSFYGSEGGIYAIRHDGHIVWYDLVLSFWPTPTSFKNAFPTQSSYTAVPAVTLSAVANTENYLKGQPGGCGFSGVASVTEESAIPGKKIIGYITSDPNDKIYGADYSDASFDDDFETWNNSRGGKGTRAEFADSIPVFYYHDALGRWLVFMHPDIIPPSGCGKPVIYLYPTHTMDVTVNLAPQGGFSKSEPAYGNGWNVTASPNGMLVNKTDGKTYPYLFWEGRGGMYSSPEKYWVVAKADVKVFLDTTLAKLGLNEKESADFMEFWYPRMQSAPYYQIGFYGTNMMNTLAPMSLSTNPDTLIRVLMDYHELQNVAPSNPPKLGKVPERKGFTVLEWGGVLR